MRKIRIPNIVAFWILFSLLIFGVSTRINAQESSWNLDFELWDLNDTRPELWYDTVIVDRIGLYPPGWFSHPDRIPEGTGLGRTTDATQGDYAVTLSGFYSYEIMKIMSGHSLERPGWPIDGRPDRLIGDYKAILLGTCDSLRTYVDVQLTRYNALDNKRDTLGIGHVVLNETSSAYEHFEVDIIYSDDITEVDTVIVTLAKRRFGFDVPPACLECSHVYFDNLRFMNPVSTLNPLIPLNDMRIFPNPAQDYFVVESSCDDCPYNISLIHSNGLMVKTYYRLQNETVIHTSTIPPSLYFIRIEDIDTNVFIYKKMIVE